MKSAKLILVIQLLLSLQVVTAQDWKPVTMGKTYHYSCDTTSTVFSIWADSSNVIGTDTILFTNRVILPCDTCNIQNYPNLNATRFLLKNQSLFLRRIIKYSGNNMIVLENKDTLVIDKNAEINNSWIFDTSANIQATVFFKGEGQILGITDSLMGILINSNDTIIISKNHGVVQWPCVTNNYFRLIGIESLDTIGYHIPSFNEIYKFQAGAVFHLYELEGYPDFSHNFNKIFKIEEIIPEINGGFTYRVNGCEWGNHSDYWSNSYFSVNDTFETIYNPYFYGSSHPIYYNNYPIITFKTYQDTLYSDEDYVNPMSCYYLIKIYRQNGLTYFEQEQTQYFQLNKNPNYSFVSPEILTNEYGSEPSTHHIFIIEKSGLIENNYMQFEAGRAVGTTALNLTGDSTGLQCTCCITGLYEKKYEPIRVYPNPNNGILYISGIENGTIEISDIFGQTILVSDISDTGNRTSVLDLKGKINTGFYLIKIRSNNKTRTIKMIFTNE